MTLASFPIRVSHVSFLPSVFQTHTSSFFSSRHITPASLLWHITPHIFTLTDDLFDAHFHTTRFNMLFFFIYIIISRHADDMFSIRRLSRRRHWSLRCHAFSLLIGFFHWHTRRLSHDIAMPPLFFFSHAAITYMALQKLKAAFHYTLTRRDEFSLITPLRRHYRACFPRHTFHWETLILSIDDVFDDGHELCRHSIFIFIFDCWQTIFIIYIVFASRLFSETLHAEACHRFLFELVDGFFSFSPRYTPQYLFSSSMKRHIFNIIERYIFIFFSLSSFISRPAFSHCPAYRRPIIYCRHVTPLFLSVVCRPPVCDDDIFSQSRRHYHYADRACPLMRLSLRQSYFSSACHAINA